MTAIAGGQLGVSCATRLLAIPHLDIAHLDIAHLDIAHLDITGQASPICDMRALLSG
jgi:hypothetical protein